MKKKTTSLLQRKRHIVALFTLLIVFVVTGCLFYNRQIKKFPTEKQNVSLKHILT